MQTSRFIAPLLLSLSLSLSVSQSLPLSLSLKKNLHCVLICTTAFPLRIKSACTEIVNKISVYRINCVAGSQFSYICNFGVVFSTRSMKYV